MELEEGSKFKVVSSKPEKKENGSTQRARRGAEIAEYAETEQELVEREDGGAAQGMGQGE